MSTKSFPSLRRLSASVLTLLLVCVSFSKGARAQATTPAVTASFAQTLTAPTGLGQVYQTALDSFGDWLVVDDANGALYEYPANGGAVITLLPAGSLGRGPNPGIAIGAANDLYLEGNYNNCLVRLPYDTTTSTWDGLSTISSADGNATTTLCPNSSPAVLPTYDFAEGDTPNVSPYYFQPFGITIDPNNNVLVSAENGNFVFTIPVNGTGITSTASQQNSVILSAMSAPAQSIAEDKFGNIYFVEYANAIYDAPPETPLPGVLMIPAGSTGLTTDAGLTRVDPSLPSVTGVVTDAAGNLYITDSTDGIVMVPASPTGGVPLTSAAVLLSPVPADGQLSFNAARNVMYVPTSQGGAQTLTEVTFNAAQFGSTPTGTPTASQPVLFGFNGPVTPGSFVIQEAGSTTPDFTIATGGTCVAGTAYASLSSCTEDVIFNPTAAGNVSAKLLMLDGSGNTLGSITLQGTGVGSALQVSPSMESVIGGGLMTPSQIAVDAAENTYVADSGLDAVEVYPKGYGAVAAATTVGTGLTAPTGVAVDGAGDVFIADNKNVYEVPAGPTGLNATGQVTLALGLTTSLGSNLQLAVDGFDDLYIADPSNGRVVKLANVAGLSDPLGQIETNLTGFNAPSAIAVDQSGDLYVGDGTKLYEITPAGVQTTLLTTLASPPTGLAVDPSGAVYVTMAGGTVRIPNVSGTLTQSAQTSVAPVVTDPTSVAIDSSQNVYIADGTAENVNFLSADASINFGTLSTNTSTQASNISVLNDGNAAFNFTAFTSTADYSATATTCSAPLAIGAACSATITFNPGPGDQGTLSATILAQSGAANSPVGVNVTGVGVSLAASATAISVTNATVDGAPAAITVTSASGTGPAPTGLVTLTITGSTLTTGAVVVTGTLAAGTVTITPPQLAAGTYTYAVSYQGDRNYLPSTASAAVTVAVGAVTLVQPSMSDILLVDSAYPYVLAGGSGSDQPYDSSASPFEYSYPVQVVATDGTPLIGQPVLDSTGKQVGENYGTVTYQIVETLPVAGGTGAGTGCDPIPVQSNGDAPFATNCLAIDTSNTAIPDLETTYTVTPVYTPAGSGVVNPNYATITGQPITFVALRNPVVQISSSSDDLTASATTPATATLTLTSLLGFGFVGGGNSPPAGGVQEPDGGSENNYTLPVQLACDGLPAYATCTFTYPTPDPSDPNSVAVGPATGSILPGQTTPCAANVGCVGPGTVILTITTNTPTGETASLHRNSGATFAAMFGLGLLGFAFSRKKSVRGRVPALLGLLLFCGVMASVSAISGCGTKQLGTTASSTITPPKGYTVSITAKQVGSRTIAPTTENPSGLVYGNENQMSLPFTVNLTVQ